MSLKPLQKGDTAMPEADVCCISRTVTSPMPRTTRRAASLGGALANLCALDLQMAFPRTSVELFNFGQPRVGNLVRGQAAPGVLAGGCTRRAAA